MSETEPRLGHRAITAKQLDLIEHEPKLRYGDGSLIHRGDLVHLDSDEALSWYKVVAMDPTRDLVQILADADGSVLRARPYELVPAGSAA